LDLLAAYRAFVRVAESGSFSAVAREMGTTQPAISRQIAALEDYLDARLIQRTTRRLTLTEDGRDLVVHARRVLEVVEESLAAVGRRRGAPAGLVRIGASVTFGRLYLAPRMPRLLARYPELSVDLSLADDRRDLIEQGLDLAIRVGDVPDTSLVARRIGSISRVIVAATDYIEARGEPAHPSELSGHDCILFDRDSNPRAWTFESAEGPVTIPVAGRFQTDSLEAGREALLGGLGVAVIPAWAISEALADGRVKPILQRWQPPRLPLHTVYPSRRHLAPRTRVVIDFLVEEFRLDPVISAYGEE
jgi:DNA-binding transcriptional LysR family regulator